MSEHMSDKMPETECQKECHNRMPERRSERMSECVPDRMPDKIAKYMSDKMSDRMPERMSERMSENLCLLPAIYIYIYFQLIGQKLCQNNVSVWGSLEIWYITLINPRGFLHAATDRFRICKGENGREWVILWWIGNANTIIYNHRTTM